MAYAAAMPIPNFVASSAGTRAVVSHPMHEHAELVLRRLGGDPAHFAARQLKPRVAASADLILTMTRSHRDLVLEAVPQKLNVTFTLIEASRLIAEFNLTAIGELAPLRAQFAADDRLDIADPIGRDHDFFSVVGSQIADAMHPIVEMCSRSAGS